MDETFTNIFSMIDEEIVDHEEFIERENEKDFPLTETIVYHSAYVQGLTNAKEIIESQII
ncbi:hypothetical protein SDC9_148372 [bioreactor metagenome]|uniref:Uncharacterized protein n=1 Tax=bioreactor metagenome TaxID=1076179 RepID=A0A645EI87_9ZZZZ